MKNRSLYWITIIELLVVIAITWILVIWVSQINRGGLSDRQKIAIFINKLVSNIEVVRNNALIWKGIWLDLVVPQKWKIDFFSSWTWEIITSYDLDWTGSWNVFDKFSVILDKPYFLKSLECLNLSWDLEEVLSQTWSIIIEHNKFFLSWCSDVSSKKLRIVLKHKFFEEAFIVNTINGVIER